MNTVPKPAVPRPPRVPSEPDPYRFGWRYVRKTRPNDTEVIEQVPLTLEDVLHPEPGDVILQTDGHDTDRNYLKNVSKARLKHDPTAAVLSDCRIEWGIRGVKPLCPDLAIFFGVARHIDWSTFKVANEGARPAPVMEVTSPDTRPNDLGVKVDYYYRAGVPVYVIADVFEETEDERQIA